MACVPNAVTSCPTYPTLYCPDNYYAASPGLDANGCYLANVCKPVYPNPGVPTTGNEVLSLRTNEADNSTTISDSSASHHVMTVHGKAYIKDPFPPIGVLVLNGYNSDYVDTPASPDFNFGTGDFTVDLWADLSVALPDGQLGTLIQQSDANGTAASIGGAGLSFVGNQIYFIGNIGGVVYSPDRKNTISSGPLSTDTWYHAAAVRHGNTVTLYINGSSAGSLQVQGAANASSEPLTIGRFGDMDKYYFTGVVRGIDITKGLARWTSNFEVNSY